MAREKYSGGTSKDSRCGLVEAEMGREAVADAEPVAALVVEVEEEQ